MKSLLLALLLAIACTPLAAAPSPATQREIDHLLAYLGNSGCQFFRNGTWYDAAKARDHLEQKRQYLVDRDLIATTEDFIAKAATQSSLSGQAYLVRCAPRPAVASGAWLTAELTRLRAAPALSTP